MKIISISEINKIQDPISVIYRDSSIGDIVACEPIIDKAIKTYHEKIGWVINVKFKSLLEYHPKIDYLITVENREQAWESLRNLKKTIRPILLYMRPRDKRTLDKYGKYLAVDKRITARTYYNYGGLAELFSKAAGLPVGKKQPKFYLNPDIDFILKDKNGKKITHYICVHCRSNRDDYGRDWDDAKWNELMEYFVKKSIYVVELGLEPVINSKSRFYINKTDIRDLQTIAHIISKSDFFIGIDSGFAHIANALEIDGVCLIGKIRGLFYYHTPFTGKFQYGGILRSKKNTAVFHLTTREVIRFYENYNNLIYMLKIKTGNWIARNIIQNLALLRSFVRRIGRK